MHRCARDFLIVATDAATITSLQDNLLLSEYAGVSGRIPVKSSYSDMTYNRKCFEIPTVLHVLQVLQGFS